jgi:hypothetical protein
VVKSYNTIRVGETQCRNYDSFAVLAPSEESARGVLKEINAASGSTDTSSGWQGITNIFVVRLGGSFLVVCTLENHLGKFALQHVLERGNYSSSFLWMSVPSKVWDEELTLNNEAHVYNAPKKTMYYVNTSTQVGMNTIRYFSTTAATLAAKHGRRVHLHVNGKADLQVHFDDFMTGLARADSSVSPDCLDYTLSPASTAPPSVLPASPDSYSGIEEIDLSDLLQPSSDAELDDLIGPASGVDMSDLKMIPDTDTTLGFGELGAFPGPQDIGDDLCMFDAHQAENEAQYSQDEDLLGSAL